MGVGAIFGVVAQEWAILTSRDTFNELMDTVELPNEILIYEGKREDKI